MSDRQPPIDPQIIDDIVRFLTDHNRSGYGRVVLHAEARRIVRVQFEESRHYVQQRESATMSAAK